MTADLIASEFQQFGQPIIDAHKHCRICEALLELPVHGYPHGGGREVPGLAGKWWLYLICPKCRYEWALWKLER